MAIKVRCSRCNRRISIDEAFAGSVCRCPYCKTINNVPNPLFGPSAFQQQRPDAPPTGAGSGPRVAMRADAAEMVDIPVADRIVFQGVATLILMVMLLAMMIAGVVLVLSSSRQEQGPTIIETPNKVAPVPVPIPEPKPANPFLPGQPRTVAGDVAFKTPVVYCIDAGGIMRGMYYYAVLMTAASVDSLEADDAFNVIIAEEESTKVISQGPFGGVHGRQIEQLAGDVIPSGVGDTIAALQEAMSFEPATIVLFARKRIDAASIIEQATEQGVVMITISMDGDDGINKSLADLAEQTGGKSLSYNSSQLQRLLDQAEEMAAH